MVKGKIVKKKTGKFLRQRVTSPKKFDPRSLRTKDIGRPEGTKIIVGCPKGKFDPKKKRCKVGTKVQSILTEIKPKTKSIRKTQKRSNPKRRNNKGSILDFVY